jgi:hypothetical protein
LVIIAVSSRFPQYAQARKDEEKGIKPCKKLKKRKRRQLETEEDGSSNRKADMKHEEEEVWREGDAVDTVDTDDFIPLTDM